MEKSIFFPSVVENISYAEKLVDEISEMNDFSEVLYGNILVTVVEAVGNAITHGNKKNPAKKVFLNYKLDGAYLCFTVRDEGQGFNHENIPDPTLPENLENIEGRGIFIMKNLSDELIFSNNGTEVTMKFKIS
jgi:serine/threonine-protein kinase RsbW